jgi:hypothetical protein
VKLLPAKIGELTLENRASARGRAAFQVASFDRGNIALIVTIREK